VGVSVKLFGSFTREKNGIASRSPNFSRRGLIFGAAATLIGAPAIVRAASLMPVKALPRGLTYSFAPTKEIVASNIFTKAFTVRGYDALGNYMIEELNVGEQGTKKFAVVESIVNIAAFG
jgi:hypothetical protein